MVMNWVLMMNWIGGLNIEGENDAYDFGTGAGFYVNATKAPYNAGYNMYSYVTEELPQTVFAAFPQLDASRVSITGHSMGGHGALTLVCTSHRHLWATHSSCKCLSPPLLDES